MGNPCHVDESQPPELIAEDGAGLQAIVVAIGYRLNIFGFLAGHGLKGNFGFWVCMIRYVKDGRLAENLKFSGSTVRT
jgi:carboxylesterase type B